MGTAEQTTAIAGELEDLASQWDPVALAELELPELTRRATQWQAGATVQDLVDAAVAAVPQENYRSAAGALLASSDHRWSQNLTERSTTAAAALDGGNYEAFRKRARGRPSKRDRVYTVVAEQVVRLASHPSPLAVASTDRSGRGRWLLAAVVLLVVGAVAAVGIASRDSDESRADVAAGPVDVTLYCSQRFGVGASASVIDGGREGWRCQHAGTTETVDLNDACVQQYGQGAQARATETASAYDWTCEIELTDEQTSTGACRIEAGAFDPSLSRSFAELSRGFRELYATGGGAEVGCPLTLMHRWSVGVIQELTDGNEIVGAITSYNDGEPILLSGQAWRAFDRVIGLDADIVGFPTAAPNTTNGYSSIPLSGDGMLVGADTNAPHFLVPEVSLVPWNELGGAEGCLGLPNGDPYPIAEGFRQDFNGGALVLNLLSRQIDLVDAPDCPPLPLPD
ncbi:MAG: hypothetical protein AAFZ07_23735 [Actinomycetota bacterium]